LGRAEPGNDSDVLSRKSVTPTRIRTLLLHMRGRRQMDGQVAARHRERRRRGFTATGRLGIGSNRGVRTHQPKPVGSRHRRSGRGRASRLHAQPDWRRAARRGRGRHRSSETVTCSRPRGRTRPFRNALRDEREVNVELIENRIGGPLDVIGVLRGRTPSSTRQPRSAPEGISTCSRGVTRSRGVTPPLD
jgi:hypothetical protein